MSHKHGPPPRLSEAELPAITLPEIIDVRGADDRRGLELRDGEYERVYSLPDPYTRLMFIADRRGEAQLPAVRRTRSVCALSSRNAPSCLRAASSICMAALSARSEPRVCVRCAELS